MHCDMFSLENRVIVITGAMGLLGRVYCSALAGLGARVIMSDLDFTRPEIYAEELTRVSKYEQIAIACDVSSEQSVCALFETVENIYGRVDVIINNAAATGEFLRRHGEVFTTFEDSTLETWRGAIDVNLTGAYLVAREGGKLMLRSGGGSIVNVSSTYGVVGPDHRIYEGMNFNSLPSYAASKAGIHGLTRWLATYWGEAGIRVNTVVPGGVENSHDPVFVRRYVDRTPLRRMATPEDLVGIMIYLSSEMSQYCTGQQYFVDGGWTAI